MEEKTIILVDDVLYTGRTVRAAIDVIIEFGRPKAIRLAVLVERRGHRELPISPDFVGETLDTTGEEQVVVHVSEEDGEDTVKVRRRGGAS